MLPTHPFLEYPLEKQDKILNTLGCYRRLMPLTPKQVSILSQGNINTVRRYLNGRLLKEGFVQRKDGLYEITKKGLNQIQYGIRIEERRIVIQRLLKTLKLELLKTLRDQEKTNQVWVQALEKEINDLHPSIAQIVHKCRKESSTWDKFKELLEQNIGSAPDFYQYEIAFAKRYIFARAERRIPFWAWKKLAVRSQTLPLKNH